MQSKLKVGEVEWNCQGEIETSNRTVADYVTVGAARTTMMKLLGIVIATLWVSLFSCAQLTAQTWDPIVTVGQE